MAHILFVYKQFPAPSVGHAGGESLFKMMVALHARGHQISLVTRILDEEAKYLPAVNNICAHILTVPHHKSLKGFRLLAWIRSYFALRRAAKRAILLWKPDLLHVETTQTALALLGLKRPPASFRTQDVNWFLEEQHLKNVIGLHRYLTWIKKLIFRCLEPFLCNKYELMLAISLGDQALLAPVCKGPELLLLPLSPTLDTKSNCLPAVSHSKNILFVGAMSRDHNINGVIWFLDEIWPKISKMDPDIHFYIVGGNPPLQIIKRAAEDNHILVTGYVDDLTPWYKAATVFVSPLLIAGGLLQKLMDAMTMGIPVVATPSCNHGISACPQTEIIIADDPLNFAQEVLDLINDEEKCAQIGLAGQRFLTSNYDTDKAIDLWESALLALLPGNSNSVQ